MWWSEGAAWSYAGNEGPATAQERGSLGFIGVLGRGRALRTKGWVTGGGKELLRLRIWGQQEDTG